MPERKEEICDRADKEYQKLLTQMPDLGGKKNGMAAKYAIWWQTRIEFKETWDPATSLKTICAFANDLRKQEPGILLRCAEI